LRVLYLRQFYGYFPLLLSIFGWVLLIQLESPNVGDLGFVALDNYWNRQGGKLNRYVLLQRRYKLELSVCLYDKYLVRYEFSKYFEGFLSRPPSRPTAEVNRIFSPATLHIYTRPSPGYRPASQCRTASARGWWCHLTGVL